MRQPGVQGLLPPLCTLRAPPPPPTTARHLPPHTHMPSMAAQARLQRPHAQQITCTHHPTLPSVTRQERHIGLNCTGSVVAWRLGQQEAGAPGQPARHFWEHPSRPASAQVALFHRPHQLSCRGCCERGGQVCTGMQAGRRAGGAGWGAPSPPALKHDTCNCSWQPIVHTVVSPSSQPVPGF